MPKEDGIKSGEWQIGRIRNTSYLKGRIGWQGLRAGEFIPEGPYLITGTDFDNGKINWDTCYHVTFQRYEQASPIHVKNGDILVTKDGTIGKVAFVDNCPEHAVLNSGIFLLRCADGSYEHKFMYHLLLSPLFETFLRKNLAGSTINHLYQNVFERFEFPIPSRTEQKVISEVIDVADEAIAKTEALIIKLKQIKSGLLYDLLTRGLDDNGQLRNPEKHPEQFRKSPLGLLPKIWEIEPLGKICIKGGGSIQTGPFGSQLHAKDYVEDGTPIITVEHLGDGNILHENLPRVSDGDYRRLSRYQLQEGDLVFSRVGAIDRCARVSQEEDGWLFSGRCLRVRLGANDMDSFYMTYQLNGFWCRRWILNNAVGSTMKCLNTTILGRLPVLKPPPNEQEMIGRILGSQEERVRSEENYLSKMKALKKGLMNDLLTGKVRVNRGGEDAA